MKNLVRSLMAATIVAVAPVTAHAAPVIDFGTGFGGAGGTVTIGTNRTGSGIFIDTVEIIGASLNNGVFDVEGPGVCGDAVGGCGILSFDAQLSTLVLLGS